MENKVNNFERLRQYLAKASFSSESDRFSAVECLVKIENADKRDADRYRWLRDKARIQDAIDFECGANSETLPEMDASIDAAIEAANIELCGRLPKE